MKLRTLLTSVGAIWGVMILSVWAMPASAACEGSRAPASQYQVNGTQVYDKKNDLTWMRCSVGQRWEEGAGCVGTAKTLSHYDAFADWSDGWRLPTLEELKTLVAEGCKNPSINEKIFPDTPPEWFHSSTKIGGFCWYIVFDEGRDARDFSCNSGVVVRLVRSGQ